MDRVNTYLHIFAILVVIGLSHSSQQDGEVDGVAHDDGGEDYVEEARGIFQIGRIPEGMYELPRLNGRMNKTRARAVCEENLDCGGFTFMGSIILENEYEIYFFHLVDEVLLSQGSYGWVYYEAETRIEERIEQRNPFKHENNQYQLDLCCPDVSNEDAEKLYLESKQYDSVDRINCSMDKAEFLRKYVLQEKTVIIENCTRDWKSQNSWTLEKLMQDKDGNGRWRVDFTVQENKNASQPSNFKTASKLWFSGNYIMDVVRRNGRVRVFDPLDRRSFKENPNARIKDNKVYLMDEYRAPDAIPTDLFQEAGFFTDYQWIILSDKRTGSELHTDPHVTTAWNSLLTGYKWWVVLPAHLKESDFECKSSCSGSDAEQELSVDKWYNHVLPQLRSRSWYGKKPIEFIQKPGDTLYLPRTTPHSVLNLEDNISITENILTLDAVEEYLTRTLVDNMGLGYADEPQLYSQLYYRILDKDGRRRVRDIISQVETMIEKYPEYCPYEEDEDEYDEDGEDGDEDIIEDEDGTEDDDNISEEVED